MDTLGPLPPGRVRPELVAAVRGGLDPLAHGAHVVVACSGGPDSSALAYLVTEARPDLVVTLGHVRHGLRDDTRDVAVVRQHAAWLGVDIEIRSVEVVADGAGLAAAARDARTTALDAIAVVVGAAIVLLGHTADDQAETVLLRLARGTGTDGLAAMAPVTKTRLRPLLRLRRSDLRGFLDAEGLPYVDDPSNLDPASRRARVRAEVLPALARVGSDPVGALVRTAAIAAADREVLDDAVRSMHAQVRRIGPVWCIPQAALDAAPAAVSGRLLRAAVTELIGRPPTAAGLARAMSPRGGTLAGGVEVAVAAGWRTVAPTGHPRVEPVLLELPGSTAWPPAGLVLRADVAGSAPQPPSTPSNVAAAAGGATQASFPLPGMWQPPEAAIDPSVLPPGGRVAHASVLLPPETGDLVVRTRRPGDRIAVRAGTARLADIMVDRGMPRAVRARWPVVVADDRVVWVPGYAVDVDIAAAGRRSPAVQLALGPRTG